MGGTCSFDAGSHAESRPAAIRHVIELESKNAFSTVSENSGPERTRGGVEQFRDIDFCRDEALLQRIVGDHLQSGPACFEPERKKINFAQPGTSKR